MKKLLSCLLGIVIVSSMLATASFAEGSSNGTTSGTTSGTTNGTTNGTTSYLSFDKSIAEQTLKDKGWTTVGYANAGALEYALKFVGSSGGSYISYDKVDGLTAAQSLTVSADVYMNEAGKSKFMITFTDENQHSSYVVAGYTQENGNDLWTMNDTQKSSNSLQTVGTFGFKSKTWSDKYTVRLKGTNKIDILKGNTVLYENVAIAADDSSSFDASKIKTITIGAYGTQSDNVTCIRNVDVTKETYTPEGSVFKVTGINKTDLSNVKISYTNTTNQDKRGIAIAAYYKDGVLVNCEIKNVTFKKSDETSTVNVEFTSFDKSNYDTNKVFLWDGTDSIKPLHSSI